jgi:hypothetical protein
VDHPKERRTPERAMTTRDARAYEVRVVGHLDDRWASWFADLTLACYADGTCTLTGEVADQAQLHGILARLRDLGSTLVSVRLLGPDSAAVASAVQQQAELAAAADGGSSVVDAELGVDVLGVRP